jgi:hypothetical protein
MDKKGNLEVISLALENGFSIPVKVEKISIKEITKMGLKYVQKTRENDIDNKIANNITIFNEINTKVKLQKYNSESYNLFRLELSLFLDNNKNIKENIIKIVRNKDIKKEQRKNELRKILLVQLSKKINGSKSSSTDMFEIVDKTPDLTNYEVKNIRDYCKVNKTKDKCNLNTHCMWASNDCKLQIKYDQALEFINKVIEEMILNNIQFKEIIQENNYFVSDIVDYNLYTSRSSQKIIKTSNFNIKKIMSEIFGKEKIPTIGRKKISKNDDINIEEDYPELIELGEILVQPIIQNMDSVIRAYVNSLYWINNKLYDIESRNLGFISDLQTQITYLLKAQIIDFILLNSKNKEFSNSLGEYFKEKDDFFESAINKFRKTNINTSGIIELLILSFIFEYAIIVYDNFNQVKFIFEKGIVENNKNNISKFEKIEDTIKIKFDYEGQNNIPYKIYSIYNKIK